MKAQQADKYVRTDEPTAGDPKVRLQVDFSPDRVEELKLVMRECNFNTYRELFNSALTMFEWAVRERRMGRVIASMDEATMKYKELTMPGLQAVKVDRRALNPSMLGAG